MRSLKVLILEGDPFQQMALHQMLNALRIFDVRVAENVESARSSLARCRAIDVAICDVNREGPGGLALIGELAIKHEARALIILGGAPADGAKSAVQAAAKDGLRVLGHLPQPVSVTGLGQLLDTYRQSYASAGARRAN